MEQCRKSCTNPAKMGWSCCGVAGPASSCPRSGEERVRRNTWELAVHVNLAASSLLQLEPGHPWGSERASLSCQDPNLSQDSILEALRAAGVLCQQHGARGGQKGVMELCNGFPKDRGRMGWFPSVRTQSSCTAALQCSPQPWAPVEQSRQGAGILEQHIH